MQSIFNMKNRLLIVFTTFSMSSIYAQEPLSYNNPGLRVNLGVGLWAWPMPMDYDEDGDMDLVVTCPDVPYNGTYFFENPGGAGKFPIFKPARKIAQGFNNVQISYVGGKAFITTPGKHYHEFKTNQFNRSYNLPLNAKFHAGKKRANQWKFADYDGDEIIDLVIGIGDWSDYGWDNAFNENGTWTNGPLHGYLYFSKNTGSNEKPKYAKPEKINAGGNPIDTYGMPSPNLADFDNDGDLDILCGEFLDGFTYYLNTGSSTSPKYEAPRRLPIKMNLQMITPTVIDWDSDGDFDVVCGDEDGRVALIENTGLLDNNKTPIFKAPVYFQQEAENVKFGALVTPFAYDWDNDGDEDLICGNTAGYIGFVENLSKPGVEFPKWAAPKLLKANGQTIRIQAGKKGSIQGPAEAKWGYTTLSVADWNGDRKQDLIVNSIHGKVIWYENVGTRDNPVLDEPKPITVQWPSTPPKPAWNWWDPELGHLVTQWRTTPLATDWDKDGTQDLLILDTEGYLVLHKGISGSKANHLMPPERIFLGDGEYDSRHSLRKRSIKPSSLRLNLDEAGKSGRRKFAVADWNGDGLEDLLLNSPNISLLKNIGKQGGNTVFRDVGTLAISRLAGHTTSPAVVDFNNDKIPDLLIGAEDGFLYYMRNPRTNKF